MSWNTGQSMWLNTSRQTLFFGTLTNKWSRSMVCDNSQSASIIDAILYCMLVMPNYMKKYLQECRSVDLLMMKFSIDRVCDNTPWDGAKASFGEERTMLNSFGPTSIHRVRKRQMKFTRIFKLSIFYSDQDGGTMEIRYLPIPYLHILESTIPDVSMQKMYEDFCFRKTETCHSLHDWKITCCCWSKITQVIPSQWKF